MLVASWGDLTEVVADREDALSDVNVQVDALDVFGNKGFVEYRGERGVLRPVRDSDDIVVDPNGRGIVLGAQMLAA